MYYANGKLSKEQKYVKTNCPVIWGYVVEKEVKQDAARYIAMSIQPFPGEAVEFEITSFPEPRQAYFILNKSQYIN